MSNKETFRNWGVVLLLLVLAGSATLLPVVRDQLGGTSAPAEAETQFVQISLPDLGIDAIPESVELTTPQVLGILLGGVVAVVIGAGVVLAGAYVFLSRQVSAVSESESYKASAAALESKDKDALKQLNESRDVAGASDHKMPRWSVFSTSVVILLFVTFFGMLVNGALVPEGEYEVGGRLINSNLTVAGSLVLATLLILVWRLRPKSFENIEATDYEPIPWDFIWVLLTGLLVVGLGIGAVVYYNVPL